MEHYRLSFSFNQIVIKEKFEMLKEVYDYLDYTLIPLLDTIEDENVRNVLKQNLQEFINKCKKDFYKLEEMTLILGSQKGRISLERREKNHQMVFSFDDEDMQIINEAKQYGLLNPPIEKAIISFCKYYLKIKEAQSSILT